MDRQGFTRNPPTYNLIISTEDEDPEQSTYKTDIFNNLIDASKNATRYLNCLFKRADFDIIKIELFELSDTDKKNILKWIIKYDDIINHKENNNRGAFFILQNTEDFKNKINILFKIRPANITTPAGKIWRLSPFIKKKIIN